MRKFLNRLVIILFALFLITGITLQTQTVRNYLKKELIAWIENETNLRVSIDDLKLYPSFQFNASNFKLFDGETLVFSTNHLHIGIYPLSLLKKVPELHSVFFETLKIHTDSFEGATSSSEETKLPSIALMIEKFTIKNFSLIDKKNRNLPSLNLKGSLALDSDRSFCFLHTEIQDVANTKDWVDIQLLYDEKQGSLQIETDEELFVDAQFTLNKANTVRISRLRGVFGLLAIDGHLDIGFDGMIQRSELMFTTKELSPLLSIEGYLYGEGSVTGPVWSPEINLSLYSDLLSFSEKNVLTNVEAKLRSKKSTEGLGGQLSLSFSKNNLPYTFNGQVVWSEALGPLPSQFIARTRLAELTELFDLDEAAVDGDAELLLSFSEGELKWEAIIQDIAFESYEIGTQLREGTATLRGDLTQLELVQFRANDHNGGRLSAKGRVDLKNETVNIHIDLEQAALIKLDDVRAESSGTLTLSGPMDNLRLEGAIALSSLLFEIPEKPSEVTDTLKIRYINQPEGEPEATPYKIRNINLPLTLDIELSLANHAKIRGQGFTSRWKGKAKIEGEASDPKVNGEILIVDGRYILRGKTFKFNTGAITFAGDVEKDTSLYLIAEIEIDRYKMEAVIKGALNNPTISFRSTPALSQREILSWILFNKGIQDISGFQGTELTQSVTSLSTGTDDGPDLLTRFGNALGLDRIDIRGEPTSDSGKMAVEVGKYISEEFYISYTQDLGTESSETEESKRVSVSTSLGKNFRLEAEVDDDQNGQINLLWKKHY